MSSWRALAFLVGVVTPAPVLAQQARLDIDLSNIRSQTLPNGLEVITIEDDSMPIVTIELAVRAGSFVEPPELNGLSHLYEHMFFKGNAVIPDQEEYLARIADLGIRFNATTLEERVNYFFTLESRRLREGMAFMKDALRSPRFDPAELAREREVVLREFDLNEGSSTWHLSQQVTRHLWHPFVSRVNPLGERRIIQSATVEQMTFFQNRYYLPNNAALIIAGAIDPAVAVRLAAEVFGEWPRGADPFVANPRVEFPRLARTVVVPVERPSPVALLQLGWQGPTVQSDRIGSYAADVFATLVSQGSAPLQQSLVESGIANEAQFAYQARRGASPVNANVITQSTKVRDAVRVLREQIERLDDPDYFSDEQLEIAKEVIAFTRLNRREQTTELAHDVSQAWASAGLDYYLGYLDGIRAVTRADLTRFARQYVQDAPLVMGILIDPAARTRDGVDLRALARSIGGRLVPALGTPGAAVAGPAR